MPKFFPWNLKAGAGGESIPSTGCPLEDHPLWSIVAGTGPSNLCWDSMDGKSVLVNADTADIVNLAFRNISMINGSIAATISMVSTGVDDWMLPLCGRMINGDNLIGARWNNGKFEVVQRKVGTWTSLFSGGPTPAIGDKVVFLLSSKFWKLIVNGTLVGEGETTLPDDSGYWGMSQHHSPGFVGHRLYSGLVITDTSLAKTPCMTSDLTPYGEASVSSVFDGGYPAWKGMDCRASLGGDCWVSKIGEAMPQWIQWLGPPGQPAMVPDRLHIEGRKITNSHNTNFGPKKITLQGSSDDGQTWDDIQTWDDLDFGVTRIVDLAVTGAVAYLGIRVRVDEVRETDPANVLTQIGTFTVYGHSGDATGTFTVDISGLIKNLSMVVSIPDGETGFIDWGDGDRDDFTGPVVELNYSHTYSANGSYGIILSQNITYLDVSGGEISGDIAKLPRALKYFSRLFNTTLTGLLSDLPPDLEYFNCGGTNTISGSIADLNGALTEAYFNGLCDLSGDISELESTVKKIEINGVSAITGDIANLPAGIIHFGAKGRNTIFGDIANLPATIIDLYLLGSNIITGDIASFPAGFETLFCEGDNTLSGDIGSIPAGITQLYCYGKNTIVGDIDTLPDSIQYFQLKGNNTVSGDIANIPPNMRNFECHGLNTLTGDIANILIGLETFSCGGENTLAGELSNLPEAVKKFTCTGKNVVAVYSTKVWASTMFLVDFSPVTPGGLTSAEVDQLLIDLASTGWDISGIVSLLGSNAPRTAASDDAVTTLIGKSVEVTTNQVLTYGGETVTHDGETVYSPLREG